MISQVELDNLSNEFQDVVKDNNNIAFYQIYAFMNYDTFLNLPVYDSNFNNTIKCFKCMNSIQDWKVYTIRDNIIDSYQIIVIKNKTTIN